MSTTVTRLADPALPRTSSRTSALLAVAALARPWFWPVSLLPYAVGVVLATHRLVPPAGVLLPVVAGAVVAGPLVWLAVLAVNDVHDLPADRHNPRKATTPLVTGRLTVRAATVAGWAAAVLALAVALVVGPAYAAGTLVALVAGVAYSAPPVRLKARAGADVAVNSLAVGLLGPLAGWTAAHGGVAGFPWALAVQGVLVVVALYVPSTLADHDADRRAGVPTFAVRAGRRPAYRVGLAAWVAAALWSVVLAATGTVFPRAMLGAEVVLVPGLVLAYHLLLRRRVTFTRIALVSLLFLLPAAAWTATYLA